MEKTAAVEGGNVGETESFPAGYVHNVGSVVECEGKGVTLSKETLIPEESAAFLR